MQHLMTSMMLVLSLAASAVMADTVVLTNGDRLTGTVDNIQGGGILLVSEHVGSVTIPVESIAELTTDAPFVVQSGGGETEGKFAFEGGQQMLVSASASAPLALADVGRAAQNKLTLTELEAEWSSRADLSAVISNGNSDTANYNGLLETVYSKDNVEHSGSLLVSEEEAEEETTKDLLDIKYGYKRFVSEKWYASGNAQYFEDALKDIDARITVGAGMGYQFWDDSFSSFSTDLGVSAVYEDIAGEDETNPALRWGLDYRRFLLQKKLEFFHNQSVLWIPDSDSGEVIQTSTGLRYALNDRVDAAIRADMNHETDPAPGSSKTDVTYTLGVGIKLF